MSYVASDNVRRYFDPLLKEWLYKDDWSKDDQDIFERLYGINVLGLRPFASRMDEILNEKNWESYSKVNQLTYSDIFDPRKMMNSFGQNMSVRAGLNFLSSNIKRLYGD